MDKTMDQSLNIGSEIKLAESITKNVKIGSVKLIREVRQIVKDIPYRYRFCIGRDKTLVGGEEVDFPVLEETYRRAFDLVLVGGLSDDEYENADAEELDKLLDRFL